VTAPDPLLRRSPADLKRQLEAERHGQPFLLFYDAEGEQHLVILDPGVDSVSIGRDEECDVCLEWDARVSRLHAVLTRKGRVWAAYDGGLSRNGTFLNGARIQGQRVLNDGDRLVIGATSIRFGDAAPRQPSTVAADTAPVLVGISPAQRKVLRALCAPYRHAPPFARPASNQDIADELVLSVEAVKGHLRVLFAKFGLQDLPQNEKRLRLVAEVFRLGIVNADELVDSDRE
jgi:FHA domain